MTNYTSHMSQSSSYVQTNWPQQLILEIVTPDVRAQGEEGLEQRENSNIELILGHSITFGSGANSLS